MRIVIGEDSALFREGLASLLVHAGHEIVGRAANADELLNLVLDTVPDVAVVDIRMPPDLTDDGARAARAIRRERPEVGVLMLSQHLETQHSIALASQGGFGYLLKDRVLDVGTFLAALERVGSGGTALDPEVVSQLMGAQDRGLVTPREREVLSLMAEGLANAGIAKRLWLTERTVETHVASIMSKLGLQMNPDENRRVVAVLRFLGQP